jgi:peptidoglycan/xylan/chitin deacetylase (PgdA/CDA1 family)
MLKGIKRALLQSLKAAGIFHLIRESDWRRQRLLILCYHSFSLEDEYLWRPAAYMQPEVFEQRLLMLQEGKYNVLPLAEALERLYANQLPLRSVAITFDDGTYDLYKEAYPRLKKFGFPATVYQTTYYTAFPRPVFNLVCSYMLWKRRVRQSIDARGLGFPQPLDVTTDASRQKIVDELVHRAAKDDLTGAHKDQLASQLAALLGIDYEELSAKRILQLMRPAEIAELAQNGIDFQLHTHRHRTPRDLALFRKEIHDNRSSLRKYTGSSAAHFCYPNGVYCAEFLPWLSQEEVISATTCDAGLASRHNHPLLLPRVVDTEAQTEIEFESWLTGVGDLLLSARGSPKRKTSIVVDEEATRSAAARLGKLKTVERTPH